jgi:hypothetical protein
LLGLEEIDVQNYQINQDLSHSSPTTHVKLSPHRPCGGFYLKATSDIEQEWTDFILLTSKGAKLGDSRNGRGHRTIQKTGRRSNGSIV